MLSKLAECQLETVALVWQHFDCSEEFLYETDFEVIDWLLIGGSRC